jgi:hypothetical protein
VPKTTTVRVEDVTYNIIKNAPDSERRTISDFIENATLDYFENSNLVADEEMAEVVKDEELINTLGQSIHNVKEGRYRIVK